MNRLRMFPLRMEDLAIAQEARICEEQQRSAHYLALKEKLGRLYDHDQYGTHAKVLAFHWLLARKYPYARQYQLFHLLSGSTPQEFYGPFDFTGPDSIEEFIERELRNKDAGG